MSRAKVCNSRQPFDSSSGSGILLVFVIATALAANRLGAVAVAVLHSLLRPLLGASGFKTHEGSCLSLFCAHKPWLFLNIAGLLQLRQSVLQRHRFTLDGSKICVCDGRLFSITSAFSWQLITPAR